ncbi:MAG: molybdopterin synthase sulfur carrier subunit, partial [Gammaproteobacteria bacterium]|nr:molybdopterin synthase sulfur carrier subunit [Gammaproteobacteria bacterium]
MTTVTVEYYASLRDAAGRDQETLSTYAICARDVFQEIAARYNFSLCEADLKVAVNDRFADWDEP